MKKKIKLSMWAKLHGYTYRGAFGLYQRGNLPGAFQTKSGAILVESEDENTNKPEYNVIYARVSSSENKINLDTQAKRISDFCVAKGWQINEITKECASGLNDNRPKLNKILKERKATRIVVEHKDRLTRFGFNYLRLLMPDCEIYIINETETEKTDLMQDFVSLVTSFCARLYGHRRNKRKTEKLITELSKDD